MKNVALACVLFGVSVVSTSSYAVNCTNIPEWQDSTVYNKGSQAQVGGNAYVANWWSQYHNPATNSGQWSEWTLIGACDSVVSSSKASIASSVVSSVASSTLSVASSAPSSISSSSKAATASSSSSIAAGQLCNWWGVATYAICKNITTGWGWENNKDCVGAVTCAALPAPYGIIGGGISSISSSVSSSLSSSKLSSSISSSRASSSIASSMQSSSVASVKSSSSSLSSVTLWKSTKLTDAVFTTGIEGPAVDANGDLYVANFNHDGAIGKMTNGTATPSLFVDLPNGCISAGIRFDSKNNMYATDYINHNIFKINVITKAISVYAHNNTMNQPNDLTIMANGIIFASDPNWSKDSGQLWRIETNGATTLLSTTMGTTNGIEVSPDNKTLYVNESVQRTIWKFDIDAAGNIANKRVFKQFDTAGLDGMRVTPNGNLFVARYGAGSVVVLSPTGAVLREVPLLGVNPTNVTFSRDYKKCYVTLQDKRWIEVFNIE